MEVLDPDFENADDHFSPRSNHAVGQVITLLWAGVRARGQGSLDRLAGVSCVNYDFINQLLLNTTLTMSIKKFTTLANQQLRLD